MSIGDHPDIGEAYRPWSGLPVRAWHLVLAVAIIAALVLVLGRFVEIERPLTAEVVILFLGLQSVALLCVVWLVAIVVAGARWSQLGLRRSGRGWIRRGFVIGFASVPAIWAVNALAQAFAPGGFRNPQLDLIAPGGVGLGSGVLVTQLAAMAVLAPFVEELLFRGLLYGWLRRHSGVAVAATLSALAFGLLHGIAFLVPAIFAQGLILALVYERAGSLIPCMLVHGTINAVNLCVVHAVLASDAAAGLGAVGG